MGRSFPASTDWPGCRSRRRGGMAKSRDKNLQVHSPRITLPNNTPVPCYYCLKQLPSALLEACMFRDLFQPMRLEHYSLGHYSLGIRHRHPKLGPKPCPAWVYAVSGLPKFQRTSCVGFTTSFPMLSLWKSWGNHTYRSLLRSVAPTWEYNSSNNIITLAFTTPGGFSSKSPLSKMYDACHLEMSTFNFHGGEIHYIHATEWPILHESKQQVHRKWNEMGLVASRIPIILLTLADGDDIRAMRPERKGGNEWIIVPTNVSWETYPMLGFYSACTMPKWK